MIDVFEKAILKTLKQEGGLTDNVHDRGGITKYGISFKFLKSVNPKATREDIENLTKQQAKDLYKTYFWDKVKADKIKSYPIASQLFDIAVNSGVSCAVRLIQQACNYFNCNLIVDGIIGNKTINAINSLDEVLLNIMLYYYRYEFF